MLHFKCFTYGAWIGYVLNATVLLYGHDFIYSLCNFQIQSSWLEFCQNYPVGTWRLYNVASMSMQRHDVTTDRCWCDVVSTLRVRWVLHWKHIISSIPRQNSQDIQIHISLKISFWISTCISRYIQCWMNTYYICTYVWIFRIKYCSKQGTRKLQITKKDIYMFKWMQYWTEPLDSKKYLTEFLHSSFYKVGFQSFADIL